MVPGEVKYPVVLNYLFLCHFDFADLSLIAHVVLMAYDVVPLLPDRFDAEAKKGASCVQKAN